MSSDSSDEENLDLLREAVDSQFINDSMFKEKTSGPLVEETISNTTKSPSLRKLNNEDDQFNLFRVTPEFQNYVAKQLYKKLEESLRTNIVVSENIDRSVKKTKKSGVKLFSNSDTILSDKVSYENTSDCYPIHSPHPSKKLTTSKKYCEEVTEDLLKTIAVDPKDILNKKEITYWSNRSKAPVFNYKKAANGTLVLVEPEYK